MRLQEDGLVSRGGHRGTSVTELDPDAATEILELRKRLETRGALRAVSAYTDAHRAELDAIRKAMAKAAQRGGRVRPDRTRHCDSTPRSSALPAPRCWSRS